MKKILIIAGIVLIFGLGIFVYFKYIKPSAYSQLTIPTEDVIDRAKDELSNGDELSLNIAAKIISTQLEESLKLLCLEKQGESVCNACDTQGLNCYANILREKEIITQQELEKIDLLREEIRNKAAHSNRVKGYKKEDVMEAIVFLENFSKKYSLNY